jgi:hypothetical protein
MRVEKGEERKEQKREVKNQNNNTSARRSVWDCFEVKQWIPWVTIYLTVLVGERSEPKVCVCDNFIHTHRVRARSA